MFTRSSAAVVADSQSFDHHPARHDRYTELLADELRAWLRHHLPTRYVRALDAGCGTGVHTQTLADRANEVLAVDLSAPMLEHARAHRDRGNIRWDRRDLHHVTLATDGPFDVVFSANTLHHAPDFSATLAHLRGLVRPGGTVLLADVTDVEADQLDHRGQRRTTQPNALRLRAYRAFSSNLLHHRRPATEAAELLRLSLDPARIAQQSTEQLLTPVEWHAHMARAFPGSVTGQLDGASTLYWRAPNADHPTPRAAR